MFEGRILLLLAFIGYAAARSNAAEIIPAPVGPYPVGMTNFELAAGQEGISATQMDRYLGGARSLLGKAEYITQALSEAAREQTVEVTVPDDANLYGALAGDVFPVAYFIAYPTGADNDRSGYEFPFSRASDTILERMQALHEEPVFADASLRYPLILITPGYNSHSIYEISHAKYLASHGYIVACLFPGDGRFSGNYPTLGKRAVRPLQVKQVLDALLEESAFGDHIDQSRIGITGSSYGGMTVAATLGARINGNENSVVDERIRAGVGVVPWFGDTAVAGPRNVFGSDNDGISYMVRPFMSLFGTHDRNAPAAISVPALAKSNGTVYAIELSGQSHTLTSEIYGDVQQWELLFFDAYLRDDKEAMEGLEIAESVEGIGEDHQRFELQRLAEENALLKNEAFGAEDPIVTVSIGRDGENAARLGVGYPCASDADLRYDLQVSQDARDWWTMRSVAADPFELFGNSITPPADGFRWAAFEVAEVLEADSAQFFRVRASR